MSRRRLRKLRWAPGEMTIRYDRVNVATKLMDTYTLESAETPLGELEHALQGMAEHVVEICELPEEMVSDLTVRSVSVSYNADGVQGLIVTALRDLENSNTPMLINTPHFSREAYSETAGDANVFSPKCGRDLDRLERCAFAYIDGERSQKELDFGESPGESEAPAEESEPEREEAPEAIREEAGEPIAASASR